jgi:OmcA/MtrC family decaheme c-type cytochrome
MAVRLHSSRGGSPMRIPHLAKTTTKLIALLAILAIAILTAGSTDFKRRITQKAFNVDAATVDFVRPGLTFSVTQADIKGDGTMTATVSVGDPKGLPLDKDGITTPGPVAINCTMAVLPNGSNDFVSYTSFPVTANGNSGTQVWYDSGGTFTKIADGQYQYTFATKAPSGFDATATHRAGCVAIRDLSEFSLGSNYAGAVLDFVPGGKPATHVHDIVRSETCDSCHATLAFHGGEAQGAQLCVMCHTKAASDPTTKNSLWFPVLIHKVHMGENLPSVKAGTPYQIAGYQGAISDFSTVALPSDPGRCVVCHDPKSGAKQANYYLTMPNRAACGACHDDVNFATGQNHLDLPQLDDNQCANCHIPQGELPLDASIMGAHINTNAGLIPDEQDFVPGMVFDNLVVTNGTAGKNPTIAFTLKDKSGNPIPLPSLATSPGRLAGILAGPATDYGYTSFGPDQKTGGYISENIVAGGTCDASGNCSYTFTHAIPVDATGTYSIGLEGRRGITILAGTLKSVSTEYGAHNKLAYFSVDGSPVASRRTVVDLTKCNACHTYLSLHGTNRDRIEQCVSCHNASETDATTRPLSKDPVQKALPPQAVSFAYMIHHIHGGADVKAFTGVGYSVVGFGGTLNDFSGVRYPVMDSTGRTGNIGKCNMCHVNGSEAVLPEGLKPMTNPQGKWNPTPITTAACTACHATDSALSHAFANTTQFGESCSVCHGANAEFATTKVHSE